MNTQTRTMRASRAGGEGLYESIVEAFRSTRETVTLWHARARQRRALADLPPHLLKDIGVTPGQALLESRKPFWRV